MLARRDTRREASRLRRLSPLQTLEDQSQTWGICCHSCTGREGLSPSWKLSYKTEVLRFTREPRSSFNQRIARLLMSYLAHQIMPRSPLSTAFLLGKSPFHVCPTRHNPNMGCFSLLVPSRRKGEAYDRTRLYTHLCDRPLAARAAGAPPGCPRHRPAP